MPGSSYPASSKKPVVSVMLPARDAAETLEEAAHSCLDQTLENLELLLIANRATPATMAAMNRIEHSDSRVRIVVAPDELGFIEALNLGWRRARGEYLARMDSDDFSLPNRFERQVSLLQSRPELSAVSSKVRILRRLPNGSIQPPRQGYADFECWLNACLSSDQIAGQRFVDSPVANPSAMIRRDTMELLQGYRNVQWAEDYDFWLRFLEAGKQMEKIPEVLLNWYDSDTRLTRHDPHYSQEQFLAAKACYLSRLPVVRKLGVAICGAGPIGKKLAKLLCSNGTRILAFLEVNQRQIGQTIAGIPVLSSEHLPLPENPVMLGAVGQPGARNKIQKLLRPFGYRQGHNYFPVA